MKARAYAAGTILNALATGIGSAFGLCLTTRVKIKPDTENSLIVNSKERDPKLLDVIFSPFGIKANVRVRSDIPEMSGLGSSSALLNAILCAVVKGEKEIYAHEILRMNSELSLRARISYTGAFDDASASLLGGIVVSENHKMKLNCWLPKKGKAAILVPDFKRGNVDWDKIKSNALKLSNALKMIKEHRFFDAMVENTKFYCEMIGYPLEIAERLWSEKICCGLSGNGPTFVAWGGKEDVSIAKEVWGEYGNVLLSRIAERPAEEVVVTDELFISKNGK
jgi:shikimate kinase